MPSMLISLQALAADASGVWQPFSADGTAAEAVSSHLRPEDPSTLTLALIGAAMMSVYLAVRRGARDRGALQMEAVKAPAVLVDVAAGDEVPATMHAEQPSRGAA
jgi:hypothetical protein